MQAITQPERPAIMWWPFSPRYIFRMQQYLAFSTGRCTPLALLRQSNGRYLEVMIVRAPQHPHGTWQVRELGKITAPHMEVRTIELAAIECARVVAGYEC